MVFVGRRSDYDIKSLVMQIFSATWRTQMFLYVSPLLPQTGLVSRGQKRGQRRGLMLFGRRGEGVQSCRSVSTCRRSILGVGSWKMEGVAIILTARLGKRVEIVWTVNIVKGVIEVWLVWTLGTSRLSCVTLGAQRPPMLDTTFWLQVQRMCLLWEETKTKTTIVSIPYDSLLYHPLFCKIWV